MLKGTARIVPNHSAFRKRNRFGIACKVHAILALSLNPLKKGDLAHYGEEETHKEEQE